MLYYPCHINIETSDACTRSCTFCQVPRERRASAPRLLDLELLRRLLLELQAAPAPLKIALQCGDEPLANPELFAYVDLCQELLPQAIWLLQTNGDLLTAEICGRLKGAFHAVVINLYSEADARRLAERRLDLVPAAEPERFQHPGRLRRAPGYEDRREEAIFHVNHKYRSDRWIERYGEEDAHERAACHHLWRDAVLGHDGKIFLCCRDSARAHPVGELRSHSLLECYNSTAAVELRSSMQRGERQAIAMCRTCPVAAGAPFDVLRPAEIARLQEARPPSSEFPLSAAAALRRFGLGRFVRERPGAGVMPWGRYDYWTARAVATELGHLCLPGLLPMRYERVVGLTAPLAKQIIAELRGHLGDALVAIWICGGRVVSREHLQQLDPTVFARTGAGSLTLGLRARLREFGRNARYSSDLDLKVLIAEGRFPREDRTALELELGARIEELSPFFPISGHARPRCRLHEVASSCVGAREAFADYNQRRPRRVGKSPHSLEAVVLLLDTVAPTAVPEQHATAVVREALVYRRADARSVPLDEIALTKKFCALDEGQRLRAHHGALTGHQLIGALLDFPDLEPGGVKVTRTGKVRAGALAVWAARCAGRESVQVD